MTWTDYIHADPAMAAGKPVVKETRLAVDFIMECFGNGWTSEEILQAFPQLTPEALQAVFAFAAEVLRDERMHRFTTRPGEQLLSRRDVGVLPG